MAKLKNIQFGIIITLIFALVAFFKEVSLNDLWSLFNFSDFFVLNLIVIFGLFLVIYQIILVIKKAVSDKQEAEPFILEEKNRNVQFVKIQNIVIAIFGLVTLLAYLNPKFITVPLDYIGNNRILTYLFLFPLAYLAVYSLEKEWQKKRSKRYPQMEMKEIKFFSPKRIFFAVLLIALAVGFPLIIFIVISLLGGQVRFGLM